MKRLLFIVLAICMLAMSAFTQTVPQSTEITNLYAVGVSYNQGAAPAISGTGLWAHKVNDSGTYSFTVVDAVSGNTKPFTVNTNFSAGVAQKVLTIGKVPIFVPTSAGISFTGTNTGWVWTTGALASIPFKSSYRICPNVRLIKSSIGNGYQPVVGVLIGWGQ